MDKNYEMLIPLFVPLFDTVHAVENLIDENNRLKKENEKLKERIKWFEKSLEENAKASGEAMHDFISACLNGRITINENNETVIKPEKN
jgi:regulator of replication initiation timing